ncbi:zeta toxin family protein [Phosphitispora sp. TUW77]|uniref:zeta toxin family protein n=1 Tax=Phosphitispora sp. TUW77 TaxID=3152361 RepID=UPI003AB1345A
MKLLVIVAGPNGSGKSTLISEVCSSPHFPKYFFSPDELIKNDEYCKIRDLTERYLAAMQDADKLRHEIVQIGLPLAFETVFSTNSKLEFVQYAKKCGYFIELIYITTNNPSINVSRVAQRVATGGHSVPEDKIIQRYIRSMKLLPEAVKIADAVKVYDNSEESPLIVFFKRPSAEIALLNKEKRHEWVQHFLIGPLLASGFVKEPLKDLGLKETERYMAENLYRDRKVYVLKYYAKSLKRKSD